MPMASLLKGHTRERGKDPLSPEGGKNGEVLEKVQLRSNVLIPKALSGPVPSTAVPIRGATAPPWNFIRNYVAL